MKRAHLIPNHAARVIGRPARIITSLILGGKEGGKKREKRHVWSGSIMQLVYFRIVRDNII